MMMPFDNILKSGSCNLFRPEVLYDNRSRRSETRRMESDMPNRAANFIA